MGTGAGDVDTGAGDVGAGDVGTGAGAVSSSGPDLAISAVSTWLEATAQGQRARPAVFSGSEVWTYGELVERARRIAHGVLEHASFAPGRRVGLIGLNSPDYLAAYFGVLRAGGVVVPLNDRLQPEELLDQLDFVDASACILTDGQTPLEGVLQPEAVWRVDGLDSANGSALPSLDPQADAMVLVTSGSTGSPKGVVHTQRTLFHAALLLATALPFTRDDVNLAFLPFFASIPEQVLPTLLAGAALDVLPRFDADAVVMGDRATTFDCVPTLISRLLEHDRLERLNRMRWMVFASEPMPAPVLERCWERMPDVATHEFYGMTEMLTITRAGPEMLRRDPGVVGLPFPTSLVRIVDDDLNEVPAGEEGEVTCLSPARMKGYLGDRAATDAALGPDGAIRTGDLGRLDDQGRLRLTGRLKDLIISGGFNIAPAEIETAACRHPLVAAAAAVGIPDDRWGETPVIVAVPAHGNSLTAAELLRHCRSNLTSYKRPSAAAIVDRLPVTGIGKSAKAELRADILGGKVHLVRAG